MSSQAEKQQTVQSYEDKMKVTNKLLGFEEMQFPPPQQMAKKYEIGGYVESRSEVTSVMSPSNVSSPQPSRGTATDQSTSSPPINHRRRVPSNMESLLNANQRRNN